jgi:replication factor C subunit 3/5
LILQFPRYFDTFCAARIFYALFSQIKYEEKIFLTPSGKKIDIVLFSSNFHVEITPRYKFDLDYIEIDFYSLVMLGYMIELLFKKLSRNLLKLNKLTSQSVHSKVEFIIYPFHRSFVSLAVVINDAERLTKDAQHALRRTMEKYSSNIRFILCCSSAGRVIAPIKSRCLLLPIATPSDAEISGILNRIGQAEGFKCGQDQIGNILKIANGNLRKAILALESSSMK